MDDDIRLKIGADNEPLKAAISDSDRLLGVWADSIEQTFNDADLDKPVQSVEAMGKSLDGLIGKLKEVKAVGIGVDQSAIQSTIDNLKEMKANVDNLNNQDFVFVESLSGIASEFLDINAAMVESQDNVAAIGDAIDAWNQKQENIRKLTDATAKANSENLKKVIGIVGRMTAVAGAAVAVYNGIISWTKEISGFNRELREATRLEKELADAQKARQKAKVEGVQDGVNDAADRADLQKESDGRAKNITGLEQRLASLGKEALELNAKNKELEEASSGISGLVIAPFANSDISANSKRLDEIEEQKNAIRDKLKKEKELIKENEEAIEQSKKKEAGLTDEQIADAKRLAEARSVAAEKLERAKGNEAGADKIKSDRERAGLIDEFGKVKGNEIADIDDETERVNARAKAEEEAAAAKAKATEEQARNERKRETEAMRSAKALSREYERDAAKRERIAQSLQRLQDRRNEIINRRDTPIGGFESGFEQLSSRIANAASKPSGDNALEKINSEIRDKQDEANKLADMHIKKAEDVGKKVVEAIAGIQGGLL